jgi:hypothetical protein
MPAMTSLEAAASLLLSITQQQQPPRLNLSFPLTDVKVPAFAGLCLRRDRLCIKSMLQSGEMPKVNWTAVKTELTFELGRVLHQMVHAHFDFVDVSFAGPLAVVDIDIDHLLLKQEANICVLHNKHVVHVATFLSEVCCKTCSEAAETINVSVEFNNEIVGGIKAVGDSDTMQKCEEAVHTANHGAAVRPQPSTSRTKSPESTEVNEAVGCPRGGTITTSSSMFPFSASTPAGDLCRLEFLPVHNTPGFYESDRWCSVRPNNKRARVPHFTPGDRLEQGYKFKVPAPLKPSLPPSGDAKLVAAATFESGAVQCQSGHCATSCARCPTEQRLLLPAISLRRRQITENRNLFRFHVNLFAVSCQKGLLAFSVGKHCTTTEILL